MKTHTIYNIDALDVVYFKFSGIFISTNFIHANKQKKGIQIIYLSWNLKANPALVFAVGNEVEINGVFTLLSK